MKNIIFIVALVILVFLGLPYVTGRVAESVTQELTQQLNSTQTEYGSLKIEDYKRGLRSTESTFSWSPSTELGGIFSEPIAYNCIGSHGLLSYAYECQAKDVPEYTDFVASELNGVDPITIGGEISVFGEATQTLSLDAFKITDKNGETLEAKSGRLDLVTDQNFERFSVAGHFGGIDMSVEDGLVQFKPMSLDGEFAVNQHKIIIGAFDLNLDGIELVSDEDGSVQLNDLKFSSLTREQGDSLVMAYSVTAEEFEQSGSGDTEADIYDDLLFDVEMSGIHMATLASIAEKLKSIAQYDSAETLGAEQESNRNAQMLAILPELEDLFKKGLALDIDLGAGYARDRIKGNLDIELLDKMGLSDLILLSVQPQSFFRKLDASLSSSIPADLVEASQENAAAIAASSWYKRKGDKYEIDLSINAEGILLNGKNMKVEEFLGALNR